jgi:cyclic pyranopterin phosphate synthase
MVNVSAKPVQVRRATAQARLRCHGETIRMLREQALPKGDALAVSRVAGIQAAKQTGHLIPLCHPLSLDAVVVDFRVEDEGILVYCTVHTEARTGVEMEALVGATTAALALYDMCKAVDKEMVIQDVRVIEKVKEGPGS